VEILLLRKQKTESESESAVANFVENTRDRTRKVKLAKNMGLLTDRQSEFVLAIYQARDFYAHNVKNLHLSIFEIIAKAKTKQPNMIFHLAALEVSPENEAYLRSTGNLKTFIYWNFAGFLSDALHVLQPPPFFGSKGIFAGVLSGKAAGLSGLPSADEIKS
jgi:hypothetical protein